MRKYEVEIRAILTKNQRKRIIDKLKNIGATLKFKEDIADYYFCPQNVKSFRGVEMNNVGSYGLRLRRRKGKDGEKTELNLKVITKYGDHRAWREHEIEISSFDEGKLILSSIGFKPFFHLLKKRTTFSLNPFSIEIEDIKGFGSAVEIEIITNSKSKTGRAKQRILDFLNNIGIVQKQIVPKSITNLLMHKKAKF